MSKDKTIPTDRVEAGPTKRFFVDMLTRDIELQDAILDLLDNCVDGILRTLKGRAATDPAKPYEGFESHIEFDENHFTIRDNCGGIPREVAINQAFMMGRAAKADENLPTVGMYGIGMKRAIFKMGRSCSVKSFIKEEAFEVNISPSWMQDDKDWHLKLENIFDAENPTQYGTVIEIKNILPNISSLLAKNGSLYNDLPNVISQHYKFIIDKGFNIYVNKKKVLPKNFSLKISSDGSFKEGSLTPYIYKGVIDDVNISLVVGFYRPMPDDDELDSEQKTRRSSSDAGWTIVCNDRVVLYNDKSILTGWGEANVPSYHTQFIGILGIVFFQSDDAKKLPLTTTKRGVESSSQIYLKVKNFMREGTKKFTDYTNTWKADLSEERKQSQQAIALDIVEIIKISPNEKWKKITSPGTDTGLRLNLPLARPSQDDPMRNIKFNRKQSEIDLVKEHLFDPDTDVKIAEIGSYCFDIQLALAKNESK